MTIKIIQLSLVSLFFPLAIGAQVEDVNPWKTVEPVRKHYLPQPVKPEPKPEAAQEPKKGSTAGSTFSVTGNGKTVMFSMVQVQGGTFLMGSSKGDTDERPVHKVTLNSFGIGETEVTQELWETVMGSNPSLFKGTKLPVERVSWEDCQEFINKLNKMTGQKFRLPTEAEWEFAARGGIMSKGYTYSGSDKIDDVAWYLDNSGNKSMEVGQKKPNELGLYDMTGNVWEWCSDWFESYSNKDQTNPKGPAEGSERVFRGGGWSNSAGYCTMSYRSYWEADTRASSLGLRLAL